MPYKTHEKNGCLMISLMQDTSASEFNKAAQEISSAKGKDRVLIDLKDCFYIQSKVLANLISLKKSAVKNGSDFMLANVSEGVFQLLEMTNLLPHFKIVEEFSSYTADELVEMFFDPELADKAAEYIADNYNDSFKQKLYEALGSGEPLLQEYAISTLGKVHDFEAEDKIRECLTSDSAHVVHSAILALGWFGDMSSKEKIYAYLESDITEVAEAAAASISLLSDESDSARLKKLLKSSDPALRIVTAKALSLINDKEGFDTLLNQLRTERDEDVKIQLAKSISSFNMPETADILLSLFDEESIKVREAAAGGLARIKASHKLDEIMDKVTDPDSWVGYFAVKALSEICTKDCAGRLQDKYALVEENVKLAIIEALGNIDYDSSDFLLSIIDDMNEDIRKEALDSLWKLNKECALEAAQTMLKNDPSWIVRFKAVNIVGELKPEGYLENLREHLTTEDSKYIREKIEIMLEEI